MSAAPAVDRRRASPLLPALLAAAFVIFLLYKTSELVIVAFLAALLAVYLAGLADFLIRRAHVPHRIALASALGLTTLALGCILALLAPAVIQQTQGLLAAIPRYLTELDRTVGDLASRYPVLRRTGMASGETGVVSTGLIGTAGYLSHQGLAYVTLSGRVVIEGVAVAVMALYLAHDPRLYADGIVALVPPRHRATARAILADAAANLREWVQAQLLSMVLLATLTGIGLWILGVPYSLAFAMFSGVVVLVPFFGSIFSTVLPALLILGDRGLVSGLAVASVGVVVHLIEANVVNPLIMQRRVRLPPVLTIFSVLVMANVGGLLGLLVAVPTLVLVMVVVRHVLLIRAYGDAPNAGAAPPA